MTLQPRPLSIRARLALLYAGLLAAALIVFGSGVYLVLRDELQGSFERGLVANAEHAADAIAQEVGPDGPSPSTGRLVQQLASTGGRVVVLDRAGLTIADSSPAIPALPITSGDLALAKGHFHAVRQIPVASDVLAMTVVPIVAGDTQVGYVVWADTTKPLRDLLTTVSAALLLGGLLVTALALVGGLVLARRALAPVAEVTETARAISLSGDFAARVEAGRPGDEVGDLAVAFNEMLQALEQNHQTLQRFLGDASHQLRTPLTTIRASLDLAVRPDLDPAERAAILADAKGEAERMGRLIADLLSLARADSGARLDVAPVELDAVLVEAVRQLRGANPQVRMSLSSVEPAVVEGDRDRLRELLGILLENAARYTPAGGRVSASLEVREGRVVVCVSDTGIGFDAQDREHLFERLYRGSAAQELRPAGTGLGLAIARWITESHGGTIDLANRPGGGTTATVSLPARTS
jgi:signal transduction histidine kinase